MKKSIALVLSTSALGVLAFAGLSKPSSYAATYAAGEEPTSKTLYVDFYLNEDYKVKAADAYVAYTVKDAALPAHASLTSVGNDIYSFVLPIDVLEATDSKISVEYVVSQDTDDQLVATSDYLNPEILVEDDYNYVCLNTEGGIDGYGYFGAKAENPGATYATQRVWLGIPADKASKDSNYVAGYYNVENIWTLIAMPSLINATDGMVLYYADIPAANTSVTFYETDNTESHSYTIYDSYKVDTLSYGVCYTPNGDSLVTAQVNGADATILAAVVESYLTYGDLPSNGTVASTVKSLYSTWFEKKSASDSALKSTQILDYTGYTANGNSYEGLTKKSSFSVNEKWNTMCSQAGIDPKTGEARSLSLNIGSISKKTLLLLFGGSAAFIALLGVFAFFMRRHDLSR